MHLSDYELILSFQQGDYSAFETLYERYLNKVYRYLFFKTNGNKNLAQDLCSETFLAGFESLGHFQADEKANFWAWMLSIAHHKFVDYVRVNHQQELSLDEGLIASDDHQILELLNIKSEAQSILDFLSTLGKEKKDIILMRIWENMNYTEISTLLGKSEEACRQLFSRTMKNLIEHFKH